MIEREAMDDEGSDTDANGESEESFLQDLENDPSSHMADYHFNEEQLAFIKKHYQHSGNFMLSHGLKPWYDQDCREGVAIARAFMTDDD